MQQTSPRAGGGGALSTALVVGGGIAVAAALLADVLGLSRARGIGPSQVLLAGVGLAAVAIGTWISPDRRRRLSDGLRRAERVTAGQTLWLAAAFGTAVGLVEVARKAWLQHVSGVAVRQPTELVWMAPLSYLVMFAVPGLLLAALVRAAPRLVVFPVVVACLTFLGVFSQGAALAWLDRGSVVLVSAGAAYLVSRSGRSVRWVTWGKRGVVVAALLLVASAVAIPIGRSIAERRALAAAAAPVGAPNVLLVVLDTVRADHLGIYGYQRPTSPELDAWAAGATVFDRALSTSSWTLPAHVSMFTGAYHGEANSDWMVPLDGQHPTLAEALTGHGYATGGFVGNLSYCCRALGIDRGFAHYEDFYVTPAVVAYSTNLGQELALQYVGKHFQEMVRNDAETITDRFLAWQAELGKRPFFAFLNYFDAHALYQPPPPYDEKFGAFDRQLMRNWSDVERWSPAEQAQFVDAYDGCIAYLDHHLGRLFDALRQRGVLDDTVVIVTSDHGEAFGEHGLTGHANSLYANNVHVPLLVSVPGAVASERVGREVSLRDLPATVCDLLAVQPRQPFPGTSFAPLLRGGKVEGLSPALSELSQGVRRPSWEPNHEGPMTAVVADGWYYIRNGDGEEELYAWNDRAQERDLAAVELEVLTRLREAAQRALGGR